MHPYRVDPLCPALALPRCGELAPSSPDLRHLISRTRLRWAAACAICALSASLATMALMFAHRPSMILPGAALRERLETPRPKPYSAHESILVHSRIFGPESALDRARTLASLGVDLPVVETTLGAATYGRLDAQGDDFSGLEPVVEKDAGGQDHVTALRVGDLGRSPVLEAAGFREGDVVVSIDGVPVGGPRGRTLYAAKLAVYELLRHGRLMVLAVRWAR